MQIHTYQKRKEKKFHMEGIGNQNKDHHKGEGSHQKKPIRRLEKEREAFI